MGSLSNGAITKTIMKLSRTSISVNLFHVLRSKIYCVLNREDFKFGNVHSVFTKISLYQSSLFRRSLYQRSLYRSSLCQRSLYQRSLYRRSLFQGLLFQKTLCRRSLFQSSLYRSSLRRSIVPYILLELWPSWLACQGLYCRSELDTNFNAILFC